MHDANITGKRRYERVVTDILHVKTHSCVTSVAVSEKVNWKSSLFLEAETMMNNDLVLTNIVERHPSKR